MTDEVDLGDGRTVKDRKMEKLIANGWTCRVKKEKTGKRYQCKSPGGAKFISVNDAYDQFSRRKENYIF